jgi:putative hydrolase of the HAD superfamily
MNAWVLFDWGDTLMRVFPEYRGKMRDWPRVQEIPGARKALHALHGRIGIALATNAADSEEADIRAALERAGLGSFIKRIYCYKTVGAKKSSPEFFAQVLQDLHTPADRVVMVGDEGAEDVEGALAAGLRAVWFNERSLEVRTGHNLATLHHLDHLPAILQAWGLLREPH